MTTPPRDAVFRRILLPLGSGAWDGPGIDAAIGLAARFHAEIVGIFIEDSDLMRLAALPFARETIPLSVSTRRLDPADMARALRVRAGVLRARLQERATRARIPWSFHVARDESLQEQLGEAAASDLLILGVGGRRAGSLRAADRVTRYFFSHGACTVWLYRGLAAGAPPVVALLDDGPSSRRVLAVAGQLARHGGKPLLVMVSADGAAEFARRAGEFGDIPTDGVEMEFRPLARAAATDLIRMVTAARGKLLVIGRDSPLASEAGYRRLLEDLPCEIVLAG